MSEWNWYATVTNTLNGSGTRMNGIVHADTAREAKELVTADVTRTATSIERVEVTIRPSN